VRDAAIQAIEIEKSFGQGSSRVAALDGLSINVPLGGVYGILGRNGAGKSTLFRLCLGLVRPDKGSLFVLGRKPGNDEDLSGMLGSMIETPQFYNYLTASETLHMLNRLSGGRGKLDVDGLLERVGLTDAAARKVHGFSVGMKQRLGIAAALLSRPQLLILDEPTSGMDPIGIQEVRALIRSLADEEGTTVVLASHQLNEVKKLCDRVALIDQGRLVMEGEVSALLGSTARLRLAVDPIEPVLELLGERGERSGDAVIASMPRDETPQLLASLIDRGIKIFEARWISDDLEQLFMRETSRALHD
jgi:ABC-2 type transport system ATP-binding protein